MDLYKSTAHELHDKLVNKEISSVELTKALYERIDAVEDQVKAYDRFFDENYLVVSQSHSRSAESKVPCHWGILYIQNDNITVIRRAQKNKQVYHFTGCAQNARIK